VSHDRGCSCGNEKWDYAQCAAAKGRACSRWHFFQPGGLFWKCSCPRKDAYGPGGYDQCKDVGCPVVKFKEEEAGRLAVIDEVRRRGALSRDLERRRGALRFWDDPVVVDKFHNPRPGDRECREVPV